MTTENDSIARWIDDGLTSGARPSPEKDPTGKSPHEPGAKLDYGKNRLGLVLFDFSLALQAVGQVGTFGANKYTPHGWLDVEDGHQRYTDAMMRHIFEEAAGNLIDADSGLSHDMQTAWNSLARLEIRLRGENHG